MRTTDIESLIPQRPPIKMIDVFEYEDENTGLSELSVVADNIFVEDDTMMAEGILEHVAQTAAALIGYRRKMAGMEVNIGVIGDMKHCSFDSELPKTGETIKTRIGIVSQLGNITMIESLSQVDGRTMAQCRMKLAN